MSLEDIEKLLENLQDTQFKIVTSYYICIYKNYKLIKFTEKRLRKIDKLMEEILNKSHNQENINYLSNEIRTEKIIVKIYRDKLLKKFKFKFNMIKWKIK